MRVGSDNLTRSLVQGRVIVYTEVDNAAKRPNSERGGLREGADAWVFDIEITKLRRALLSRCATWARVSKGKNGEKIDRGNLEFHQTQLILVVNTRLATRRSFLSRITASRNPSIAILNSLLR
jgi:hypothetical protein